MSHSMEDVEELFKRKNWRLFQKNDYIIQSTFLNFYKKPHDHIKQIICVDMKQLRYEWKNSKAMGFVYFREANAYQKVTKKLKMLFKLING